MKQFISLFCIGIISLFCCVSGYGQTKKIERLTETSFITNAPKTITIDGKEFQLSDTNTHTRCFYETPGYRNGCLPRIYIEALKNKINSGTKRYDVSSGMMYHDGKEYTVICIQDCTLMNEYHKLIRQQKQNKCKEIEINIVFNN